MARRNASCLGRSGHMKKKRHHYVPIAYLNSFCDDEGMVFVYRKDDPTKPFRQKPDSTGFHKYYYSQPMPEGGINHDALENFFSEIEATWPPIVERLQRQEKVDAGMIDDISQFICLQFARVPANRDFAENIHAETLKTVMWELDKRGEFPLPPKGYEDILDHVQVSIDPHQSILAMPNMIGAVVEILDEIGLDVIHNETEIPFLTSDNPVIWFDPSVPEEEMQPYNLQPGGPVMLLFPIAPNLMVFGGSFLLEKFARDGIEHVECRSREFVNKCNRYICRFAYETVFARERGQDALIEEHADVSPVLEPTRIGPDTIYQRVFGKRKRKPTWKKETKGTL